MRLFPDHSVFEPGVVKWDHFDQLDPTRPLGDQESLWGCEDPFYVEYPNGVSLDVSYLGNVGDIHRVVVDLGARSPEGWTQVLTRECVTVDQLRNAILELNVKAKEWKS